MPKYDLMFGCFGNGTTVCNRAQTEHGDYKIIAHISEGGNVKYYVDNLPAEVVESIEKMTFTAYALTAFLRKKKWLKTEKKRRTAQANSGQTIAKT